MAAKSPLERARELELSIVGEADERIAPGGVVLRHAVHTARLQPLRDEGYRVTASGRGHVIVEPPKPPAAQPVIGGAWIRGDVPEGTPKQQLAWILHGPTPENACRILAHKPGQPRVTIAIGRGSVQNWPIEEFVRVWRRPDAAHGPHASDGGGG